MTHQASTPCLFNLVLFSSSKVFLEKQIQLAEQIVAKFPARFITFFLDLEKEGAPTIEQMATKETHPRVSITLTKDELPFADLYLYPYLEPDYPIYLFYGGDFASDINALQKIAPFADRILVNSSFSTNLSSFAFSLLHLMESQQAIVDINWVKTSGWRILLRELFQSEGRQEELAKMATISLTYQSNPSMYPQEAKQQALLFQAWLTSCLGWTFHSFSEDTLTYTHHDVKKRVILQQKQSDAAGVEPFSSLILKTEEGQEFCLQRQGASSRVSVHISSKETCEMPITLSLSPYHKGTRYLSEVVFSPTSDSYKKALEQIVLEQKVFS